LVADKLWAISDSWTRHRTPFPGGRLKEDHL
jgi:hypothetical protein